MAVSANAVTLAQYAMMSNDPLVQVITYGLLQNAIVMQDIPILTKSSLTVNGVRWTGSLPSVNWAQLNTDPTVVSGTPGTYQEQAYVVRNAIDVDRWLLVDQNQIMDPRQAQLGAYLKAFAYDFNHGFVNAGPTGTAWALTSGQTLVDANRPVGIRFRLDNPTTYGVKLNSSGTAEAKIDASGATADLSSSGRTATTVNAFLEKLDQLLWAVDAPDGTNVILYANDDFIRKFQAGLRIMGSSALDITRDNFDRAVLHYKNAIIRDIGYLSDQSSRIITSTETNAGVNGSSTFTSVYAVRADTDHFFAWQMAELMAQDIGLVGNAGTIYRFIVDWACGFLQIHPRAVGRLYDIKVS